MATATRRALIVTIIPIIKAIDKQVIGESTEAILDAQVHLDSGCVAAGGTVITVPGPPSVSSTISSG